MDKLYLFVQDCSRNGCVVTIAKTEAAARKPMESSLNYDKNEAVERHEITEDLLITNYGDM